MRLLECGLGDVEIRLGFLDRCFIGSGINGEEQLPLLDNVAIGEILLE